MHRARRAGRHRDDRGDPAVARREATRRHVGTARSPVGLMASVVDLFRLDGKLAFVSGASRGLGRIMALALADAGANVAISGRTAGSLAATVKEIESRGVRGFAIEGDMADPAGAEATCRAVLENAGTPDILLNNVCYREANVPIELQTTRSSR